MDALITAQRLARAPIAAGLALALIATGLTAPPAEARGQDNLGYLLRPDLDAKLLAAAGRVEFGVLPSGDPALDALARQGLSTLAEEAGRRSALEGAAATPVSPERDELSVYPLLYWPITPATPIPSDAALNALERYMAGGGLLIIDTADGERQGAGVDTPAAANLRQILIRMNIPPLEPLPADSILKKSFYRLDDVVGRHALGTVWVESRLAVEGSNDRVPSLVIAGRDFAGAWARDANGIPLRPMSGNDESRRELALRAGINFAMVALTGNYKEDQAHVQRLLDRVERRP